MKSRLLDRSDDTRVDNSGGAAPLSLSMSGFRRLASYVSDEVGIKINDTKLAMVQSRLMRRARHLNLPSLDDYLEHVFTLPAGEGERVHFIDAITTNKTDFFREPQHFKYLMNVLARAEATGTRRRGSFKVWCAGCSTGEEAYTLAMVLQEHAGTVPAFDYSIFATDISTKVLTHARTAIYTQDQIGPIPLPLREKYLMRSREPSRQVFRIVPELRRKVSFDRLNFMDRTYPVNDTFDAIFFRNVLIYFERATQEAVVNRLCRKLIPGGHLFVGHSESLGGLDVPLRQVVAAVFTTSK